jgi:hypothetical protein
MSADLSNSAGQLSAIADDARTLAGLIQTALSIGSDYSLDGTFGIYLKRLQRLLTNTDLRTVNSLADWQVLRQLRIRADAIMKAVQASSYEPSNEDVSALEYAAKRIDEFLVASTPSNGNGSTGAPVHQQQKTALTGTAGAALAIVRAEQGRGLVAKEIVKKLSAKGIRIEETTFRRHIVPQLKAHGVENNRARGGYYDSTCLEST